ncbi:MAG: HAMP domain-containing sensor histidine kinase [Bacteroidota bacterium]
MPISSPRASWLLMLATLSLCALVGIQARWLWLHHQATKTSFDTKVALAMRRAGHELLLSQGDSSQRLAPLLRPSAQEFRQTLGADFNFEKLEHLVHDQLARHEIHEPYQLLIYRTGTNKLVLGFAISQAFLGQVLPCVAREQPSDQFDFAVAFPHYRGMLWRDLLLSLATAVLSLFILAYFAYSLSLLLREKRLSALRQDLLHNIAHELKTPLANLSLAGEVLQRSGAAMEPSKAQRYAGIVHQEAQRLQNLVDRSMRISLLETETDADLEMEPFELISWLGALLDSFEPRLQGLGGELYFLPESPSHVVLADPVHLAQVVSNLIDNAIKYGGNPPVIEVRVYEEQADTQIVIRDFGTGIPRMYHDQVFEKFFRVPQGNRHDQPGSGLGLAYVKAVMARHGGSVRMESHPGRGTAFFLELPRTDNR